MEFMRIQYGLTSSKYFNSFGPCATNICLTDGHLQLLDTCHVIIKREYSNVHFSVETGDVSLKKQPSVRHRDHRTVESQQMLCRNTEEMNSVCCAAVK